MTDESYYCCCKIQHKGFGQLLSVRGCNSSCSLITYQIKIGKISVIISPFFVGIAAVAIEYSEGGKWLKEKY